MVTARSVILMVAVVSSLHRTREGYVLVCASNFSNAARTASCCKARLCMGRSLGPSRKDKKCSGLIEGLA